MNEFLTYLSALNISVKSLKNYKSDVTHFTAWIILKVRSYGAFIENLTEAIPFLNKNLVWEYKTYLLENSTPDKTINRRLSTLRHLAKHLLVSQIVNFDFMEGVENITQTKKFVFAGNSLVDGFKSHLTAKKASRNTIKNYISDVRQFLSWLESKNQTLNSKL